MRIVSKLEEFLVREGSRQVLAKVMLFQLMGQFHPLDGATPSFFYKSWSYLLVLSIDVSFVLKFFWKGDKNLKNWTSGPIYMEDPVVKKSVSHLYPILYTGCAICFRHFSYYLRLGKWRKHMVHPVYAGDDFWMRGIWLPLSSAKVEASSALCHYE